MSYQDRLIAEIHAKLDALALAGQPWRAKLITTELCSAHSEGLVVDSDHASFWQHCGYTACREMVTKCINKRAGDRPANDTQGVLPGWQHLQSYYIVRRRGEDIGVSVFTMTGEEITARAALYRQMGYACFAHANELDRFMAENRAA